MPRHDGPGLGSAIDSKPLGRNRSAKGEQYPKPAADSSVFWRECAPVTPPPRPGRKLAHLRWDICAVIKTPPPLVPRRRPGRSPSRLPDPVEASLGHRAARLLLAVIERATLLRVHAHPCILVDATPELVEALMVFQSATEDLEGSHDAEDDDPAEESEANSGCARP